MVVVLLALTEQSLCLKKALSTWHYDCTLTLPITP